MRMHSPDELDTRRYEALARAKVAGRQNNRVEHRDAYLDFLGLLPSVDAATLPAWATHNAQSLERWKDLAERLAWLRERVHGDTVQLATLALSQDPAKPIEGVDRQENARAAQRLLQHTAQEFTKLRDRGIELGVAIDDPELRTAVEDHVRGVIRSAAYRLPQGEPLRLLALIFGDNADMRLRCYHCGAPRVDEGEFVRCPWCGAARTRAHHPQVFIIEESVHGLVDRGDDESALVSAVVMMWITSSQAAKAEMPPVADLLVRLVPWVQAAALQPVLGSLAHIPFAGARELEPQLRALAGTWQPQGQRPKKTPIVAPQTLAEAMQDTWARKNAAMLKLGPPADKPLESAIQYGVGATWATPGLTPAQVAAFLIHLVGPETARSWCASPAQFHQPTRERFVDAVAALLQAGIGIGN